MTTLINIREQVIESTRAAVLELVQAAPRMISDIMAHLGVTFNTARDRLRELEQAGQITHTRQTRLESGGFQYVWHLHGVVVDAAKHYPRTSPRKAKRSYQDALKAPVLARDPLTAALFGTSRREAA